MNPQILSQARKLYELAQKAKLLTTESFSDVYPEAKLQEILARLDGDKAAFIENNQPLSNPEKIWDDGVEARIKEDIAQTFMDFLQEHHQAFMVNWDQPVEDIVFNFQTVSSVPEITALGEKQVDGKWIQSMKIGDKIYDYQVSDEGFVPEVLYDINRSLFPLSKSIICAKVGDENQYLVIDLEFYPEFADFGFATF